MPNGSVARRLIVLAELYLRIKGGIIYSSFIILLETLLLWPFNNNYLGWGIILLSLLVAATGAQIYLFMLLRGILAKEFVENYDWYDWELVKIDPAICQPTARVTGYWCKSRID
jgi:hypothetical protein